ncbi:PH domain-containing protein [Veillonella criceti]|uniref:YokE-like PH domain-containing protein n=1 Tax=Veillonella criceti TaxID=103891 RepID=A0A380NPL2_9FIRM|nr:hypothetical protein [Veillonella criceti]SUP44986.1 Uncharacterised protein [Veillonella criceti]
MHVIYKEQSKRSSSASIIVGIFVIALLGAMVWTTMRSIEKGAIILDEYFVEIVALLVILKSAIAQYTYLVTDDKLVIVENVLFYTKKMEIPYAMIDGVYAHKTEFISKFKLRYKYRKSSTTDSRPTWALIYSIVKGKKVQNARVLIKADTAFFKALEEFVPNRICAPQGDVVLYAYARRDAIMHGESVEEYFKSFAADPEEEILVQEDTAKRSATIINKTERK